MTLFPAFLIEVLLAITTAACVLKPKHFQSLMFSKVSRGTAVMARAVSCWYQVEEKLPISIPVYRFTISQMCLHGPNKTQALCRCVAWQHIKGLGPLSSTTWGAL